MRQTSKPPTPLLVEIPTTCHLPDRQPIRKAEIRGSIPVQFLADDEGEFEGCLV
jgi:hypothetical protein